MLFCLLHQFFAFVLRNLGMPARLLLPKAIDLSALTMEVEYLLSKAFFDARRTD